MIGDQRKLKPQFYMLSASVLSILSAHKLVHKYSKQASLHMSILACGMKKEVPLWLQSLGLGLLMLP